MAGLSPKLPIQRDSADGYALTKTYQEMVIQNLKNLILTVPGERMMDPLFGVGLSRFLFEFNSVQTYSEIYAKTLNQVASYMPFVKIENMVFHGPEIVWSSLEGTIPVKPSPDADHNTVQIMIYLSITPLSLKTTLSLDVQV